MLVTPPLCAQATAVLAAPPLTTFGADAEVDEDDDEELVDDDSLLCGDGGRPLSRRAKKAAARSELITSRLVLAKSRSHCAFVCAHHGIAEPKSAGVFSCSLARTLRDHATEYARADPCPPIQDRASSQPWHHSKFFPLGQRT